MAPPQNENSAPPRPSRAERGEQIRNALLDAAGEVVGELGYQDASVARITMRAGVAQGTFYNYFKSRQDLFDELLPRMGQAMLAYIRDNVDVGIGGAERERQRFAAYLHYLRDNPGFYRVLYQAETLAPQAHRDHIDNVVSGYVRGLKRSWNRGEMPAYDAEEIEAIAYILTAIRDYFSMRYGREMCDETVTRKAIETYTKVIRHGVFSDR